MVGGPADAQAERLLEDLILPGRLVVGVEQDVGVGVDQAGQEPGVAEVDHFGGLPLQLVRRSDLRDPVAFDQHRHAVARGVGVSIDQVRRLDQDALGRP